MKFSSVDQASDLSENIQLSHNCHTTIAQVDTSLLVCWHYIMLDPAVVKTINDFSPTTANITTFGTL